MKVSKPEGLRRTPWSFYLLSSQLGCEAYIWHFLMHNLGRRLEKSLLVKLPPKRKNLSWEEGSLTNQLLSPINTSSMVRWTFAPLEKLGAIKFGFFLAIIPHIFLSHLFYELKLHIQQAVQSYPSAHRIAVHFFHSFFFLSVFNFGQILLLIL